MTKKTHYSHNAKKKKKWKGKTRHKLKIGSMVIYVLEKLSLDGFVCCDNLKTVE